MLTSSLAVPKSTSLVFMSDICRSKAMLLSLRYPQTYFISRSQNRTCIFIVIPRYINFSVITSKASNFVITERGLPDCSQVGLNRCKRLKYKSTNEIFIVVACKEVLSWITSSLSCFRTS